MKSSSSASDHDTDNENKNIKKLKSAWKNIYNISYMFFSSPIYHKNENIYISNICVWPVSERRKASSPCWEGGGRREERSLPPVGLLGRKRRREEK